MSSTFDLAEALINFASGSEVNWNSFALPIPSNVLIYTNDSKMFKRGDGIHKFSELPAGPTIAGIASGSEAVTTVLTTLLNADDDKIIIIDNEVYMPSSTRLTDLVSRLTAIANKDTVQDANLATIQSQFGLANTAVYGSDDNKLVVTASRKMSPGVLPESLVTVATVSPIGIKDIGVYADQSCTQKLTSVIYNSIYYVKINASHDTADIDALTFGLTSTSANVTITNMGRGLFKVVTTYPISTGPVTFTGTVLYNADQASMSITVQFAACFAMMHVFNGPTADHLSEAVVNGNYIFAVGRTNANPSNGLNGELIIVKYDMNLNVIKRRRLAITSDGLPPLDTYLDAIALLSTGDMVAVGNSKGGTGTSDILIVKFNTNLDLSYIKYCGGGAWDHAYGVGVDASDNIYVVGQTYSESAGRATGNYNVSDGIILKLNSSLALIAQKRLGGYWDEAFKQVVINSYGIFIAMWTSSYQTGYVGCVAKYDTNLGLVGIKYIVGASNSATQPIHMTTDTSGNLYLVGITSSGSSVPYDGILIKLDSNLNEIAQRRFNGTGNESFLGITFNPNNNHLYVVGHMIGGLSSGAQDGFIFELDTNLSIINQKHFGGAAGSVVIFYRCACAGSKLVIVGECNYYADASDATLAMVLENGLTSGTFSCVNKPAFSFADMAATLTVGDLTITSNPGASGIIESAGTLWYGDNGNLVGANVGLEPVQYSDKLLN